MAKAKISNISKNVGQLERSYIAGRNAGGYNHFGKQRACQFPKKLNICFPYDPAIPILVI